MKPERCAGLCVLILTLACQGSVMSPLQNKLAIGQEPYIIFVGDGPTGPGDLFAVSTGGGPVHQVTFSRVEEILPALSPDGTLLAFARVGLGGDSNESRLWVMNLANGGEQELPRLPREAVLLGLSWGESDGRLYVATETDTVALTPGVDTISTDPAGAAGVFRIGIGPGRIVPVAECGSAICRGTDSGQVVLAEQAEFPFRWADDSLGYLRAGRLEVRPLAGGQVRIIPWVNPPANPREPALFIPRGMTGRSTP